MWVQARGGRSHHGRAPEGLTCWFSSMLLRLLWQYASTVSKVPSSTLQPQHRLWTPKVGALPLCLKAGLHRASKPNGLMLHSCS